MGGSSGAGRDLAPSPVKQEDGARRRRLGQVSDLV